MEDLAVIAYEWLPLRLSEVQYKVGSVGLLS